MKIWTSRSLKSRRRKIAEAVARKLSHPPVVHHPSPSDEIMFLRPTKTPDTLRAFGDGRSRQTQTASI